MTSTKVVVDPGESLSVGRSELSDLVVPHDAQMSATHFELRWDGERCTLRDLGSMTGTKLGGKQVEAGEAVEVEHGGWIQAGETDFMVYVEGHTPPPEDGEEEGEDGEERGEGEGKEKRAQRRAAAEAALAVLREEAAKTPLYAVLDSARDERILELLRESVEKHQSLYEGQPGEPLADVAPYLAGPMRQDSRLLERLVLEGWGRRWGIWCTSEEIFVDVRRHWRRFLMVELEDGAQKVYFRFYDPGVLAVFMPICTTVQLADLTRQLERILYEDKQGQLISTSRPRGPGVGA